MFGKAYIGVYDGHGGREIVDFLEENLERNILNEICREEDSDEEATATTTSSSSGTTKDSKLSVKQRLTTAFLMTDIQSHLLKLNSGSTVVSLLFKKETEQDLIRIYSANCGDARAVLGRRTKIPNSNDWKYSALRLSHDHKADDPVEVKRIEAAGGFVLSNRVLGILAVARAIGDHALKEYITCEPYISETIISKTNDAEFVIIACDGLWDVLSDTKAVDLVTKHGRGSLENKKAIADVLAKEAILRGSTDNITVVVAWLHE